MFPTNNKFVVNKLMKRSMKANKLRNLFIILAIALTTFLISSVFSIGMSFIESYQQDQIRMLGTLAHGALTKPGQNQTEKMKSLDYIDIVGVQTSVATVVNLPETANMQLALSWFDKNEWEKLKKPAISNITGYYPEKDNEIMAATWILEGMGITNPRVGMEIELSYRPFAGDDPSQVKTGKFILSGFYTEYMNLRTGNAGSMLVSKVFADNLGATTENLGAASFRFKRNSGIGEQIDRLAKDITMADGQKIKIAPIYETSAGDKISTLIGLGCIVFFLMLSGFLLIYNVLYISVSKDVRFFGLLKTVGTTPKQIKKLVTGQTLRLSIVGIPLGLLAGTLASFLFVPLALSGSTIETGVKISFSPLIYAGAALFALLTASISSIKPARKAASISPVEAMRYTGIIGKGRPKRSTSGGKLYRMAFRNIFRERKRALVVFTSLFLGMTTFLTINTLVLSMDTENYVKSYINRDFTLKNNTISFYSKEAKQKFDADLISDIEKIQGVKDLNILTVKEVNLQYDQEIYEKHLKNFFEKHKTQIPSMEQIRDNPQLFWTNLVGLDSDYIKELNKKLAEPIDVQAFERGDIALISTDNPDLYQLNSILKFSLDESGQLQSVRLGGFLPYSARYDGGVGMAPNLYVSNSKMKELVKEPMVYSVSFDTDDRDEAAVLETLKEKFKTDHEISIESKLEIAQQFQSSKTMLHILGAGMSVVLALIGILNFVNVMLTGVTVRKHEFAVMESIGLTSRQLRKMLLYEGLAYSVISCGLVTVAGNGISYGLFKMFQQQADYAIFTFPMIPFVVSIIMVIAVCLLVPMLAYRWTREHSVIERLRSAEA